MSRLRGLRVDERGTTLPELLTTIVIGVVVLLGTYTIVDSSQSQSRRITDRQDALTRGRVTLEQIAQSLRSQVCVATTPAKVPIVSGTATSITFYMFSGDPTTASRDSGSGQAYPSQRTIAYASGTQSITESTAPVTSFSPFNVGSATTRTLATNVILPDGKLFAYYGPSTDSASAASTTALSVPLTATTAASVVKISIGYKVLPTGRTDAANKQATLFKTDVFWRAVDPTNPTEQPCDDSTIS
jgi:Tfp pilus assembly protein PilW